MQQSKPEAPKASADGSEDKAGDGDGEGSGGDGTGPAGGDSDRPAAADKDAAEDEGAAAMDEGPADGGTGSAAAAGQGSKDSYLLQPEDLKSEDLAAHTGQLDVMLEYLWQVRKSIFLTGYHLVMSRHRAALDDLDTREEF